tara:strand:- start:170002 stop:170241 length:240 start_codon:yes stop_codon:yes gene_type:complete
LIFLVRFWIKPALIYNSLRACPDLSFLRACPDLSFLRAKNEQVEIWITIGQNQIVLHALTKALQPWLEKYHPYVVLGIG